MRFHYLLIVLLFTLSACGDDPQDLTFEIIEVPTVADLSAMSRYKDQLVIVGGEVFDEGIAITGNGDGWITWPLGLKQVFGVDCDSNGCVAVGQDGFYYTYHDTSQWTYYRLTEWGFQRSVTNSGNGSMSVAGKSFGQGNIYHINDQHIVDKKFDIEAELADVAYLGDSTYIAVGYGAILRSTDEGSRWTQLPIEGDFYHSVDFFDSNNGIIVGLAGSILLTDDGGQNWEQIQGASRSGSNRKAFRKVRYTDQNNIYIVGDSGLLWQSIDAGKSWTAYQINTHENLNDLQVFDAYIYVVGSNGYFGSGEL